MPSRDVGPTVAVVGAGVVGTAIALSLQRRGRRVVLMDRDEPGSGCSAGNSGAISPGSVAPMALPGVLASVPKMLLDRQGPLHLPVAYLPQAAPWLMRFVASAQPDRVVQAAQALDTLNRGAVDMHRRMTQELGVPELFLARGHLHLYPDEAALRKDAAGWKFRADFGYTAQPMDRSGIERLEPAAPARYQVGMYLDDHATILNPRRYVQAMARAFVAAGGEIERVEATALVQAGRDWRIAGARDRRFEHVTVAGGAWSRSLLAPLGVHVPLESQRGYHVQFEGCQDIVSRTVVLADRKVFVTPMEQGLRFGGMVEIGGLKRAPDPRRWALLERMARESFPALRGHRPSTWMGHRPCMPDSVPRVGAVPERPGLWLAVGHGHLGLTGSLPTASLITQAICGAP